MKFYPNGDAPMRHSANCTRMGVSASDLGECVGYHCAFCGGPSSSQGHTMCLERARAERNRQNATI